MKSERIARIESNYRSKKLLLWVQLKDQMMDIDNKIKDFEDRMVAGDAAVYQYICQSNRMRLLADQQIMLIQFDNNPSY